MVEINLNDLVTIKLSFHRENDEKTYIEKKFRKIVRQIIVKNVAIQVNILKNEDL